MIKPEVLSPAGDWESLCAAILYGADAVYLGAAMFGMRASSAYFEGETLVRAVEFAHNHGVRIYLTCNTLPTNEEADQLPAFLHMARDAGVDALIVADVGIMMLARRLVPEIPIHISTQAGITNHLSATEFYKLGASRVVLAREMSLADIAQLRRNTPPELEIEAFVHGAMCMSVSGRCLLSSYLVGRDANRGQCAQPCRWGYHLMEEKRPGLYFPVFEDERGSYILNAKDMCMIEHIDKLAQAGISSMKIEGRGKSAYYTATVTNAYRAAVDAYMHDQSSFHLPDWVREEVYKVSHRAYSTGFYFGTPDQYNQDGGYVRNWDVAAVVLGYEDGLLAVSERNKFSVGEVLEAAIPGQPPAPITVTSIFDTVEGCEVESARHPTRKYLLRCDLNLPEGAMLRRELMQEAK